MFWCARCSTRRIGMASHGHVHGSPRRDTSHTHAHASCRWLMSLTRVSMQLGEAPIATGRPRARHG